MIVWLDQGSFLSLATTYVPVKAIYQNVSGSWVTGATTASPKTLIGYATDGYPIYGYATNSAGATLQS